nr:probable disease resistance RPP8-like protein 2 [Ipomoea batatas]GME18563.1 probable disease resistance RPP8-like protein 2 [Ipomoea batatas]
MNHIACMDIDANPESLVSFVTEESKERPFSVVYGPEGLGKTTVVQNVYNKPEVRHQFTGCAWITVTHHLQHKTPWKDILSQIHYRIKDDDTDRVLLQKLHSAFQDVHNKYLIVLDGICSMEGWEDFLKRMAADKMLSKVVITTRNIEATKRIIGEEKGHFLQMRPLTEDQSWQFLKTQLLSHPSDFESTLKEICKKCEGVPLALKLLGNLMAWKERIEWNELRQQECCVSAQQLLELSYSLLPEHLKTCLHYLALFPEETVDIEADKLCNLWIADEDINKEPQDGMLSTAETYLQKLATLGLVQVQEEETPTPTKIKSCSLPHYVRDFLCRVETKERSLFATAVLPIRARQETPRPPQVRALAFHFDKRVGKSYDFPFQPKETHKEVRSILFLNTRQQDGHLLSPKPLDLTNCKLLRALDFNWLDFRAINFPQGIKNLTHLRYLSFRDCYLENFPPSIIGKLEKLETLDLRVNPEVVCKIERISKVLSQLKRLRSLYLPYKFADETGETKLQLGHLSELQNLQNFVSTHCRANDLRSLKKLSYLAATFVIRKVQDLEETIKCLKEGASKSSSIHLEYYPIGGCASALSELLAWGSLNALQVDGQILKLPSSISDTLTEIFLIASELKEDPMPLLGKLHKLQKLGLSKNAFLVKNITCTGFPQLRYLKLSNLPELKTWTIEEGAMLKLSTLTIEKCKSLETLPDGLSTLQELSFVNMPETFTDKYERQGEDFCKIQHVLNIKIKIIKPPA